MMNIIALTMGLFILSACNLGEPSKGTRGLPIAVTGVDGLENSAYTALQADLSNTNFTLEEPVVGESMSTMVVLNKVKYAKFNLPVDTRGNTPECSYKYQTVQIDEVVILEDSILKLEITKTPQEATYSGIGMRSHKESCDALKATSLVVTEKKIINVGESFNKLKKMILGQVVKLVDTCENRGYINGKLCNSLTVVNMTKGIDRRFKNINYYDIQLKSTVSPPRVARTLNIQVSLENVYFTNLGLLNFDGQFHFPLTSEDFQMNSLELLSWQP